MVQDLLRAHKQNIETFLLLCSIDFWRKSFWEGFVGTMCSFEALFNVSRYQVSEFLEFEGVVVWFAFTSVQVVASGGQSF